MRRVEEDAAKGDRVAPIDRHQPYDRPRASDFIESAIDERGNVSYTVIDDAAELLAARKAELIFEVGRLEQLALAAVSPPGKERLRSMREAEVRLADDKLMAKLIDEREKPGFIKRLFGKGGEIDVKALAEEIQKRRPKEDTQHLMEQDARRSQAEKIAAIAAQAMHDIEDLTTETIVNWKAPDFSGV